MRTSDLLNMSVQNLRRRKFRTFLTIIGVIIGTCAIISMISIGIGINASNDEFISSWGDLTMIDIYGSFDESAVLNDAALAEIGAIPDVTAITPFENTSLYDGKIVAGKNDRYAMEMWSINGVYPEALEALDYNIDQGRYIDTSRSGGKYIELVVGSDVAYNFEDTKRKYPNNSRNPWPKEDGTVDDPFFDIMNETLTFKIGYGTDSAGQTDKFLTYEAKVVGVLDQGEGNNYETRGIVYMDIKDMRKMEDDYKKAAKVTDRNEKNYNRVKVRVGVLERVSEVQKDIEDMGFFADSMEGYRKEAMQKTQQMQILLAGLAAISMVVAAISIANTMVMSVYERTREIGIMKVVGCYVSDIRKIFLTEATIIGFVGGIIGVILAFIISYFLNNFGGSLGESMGLIAPIEYTGAQLSIIPGWLIGLGMGFATVVGISAGFYPASRAVKISALEAIKTE